MNCTQKLDTIFRGTVQNRECFYLKLNYYVEQLKYNQESYNIILLFQVV